MIVTCPSCGAPVEFRYDDSFVRVCDHCRAAVVRTDRGADTLGKFADLAPIASPLRLFAEGHYGSTGLLLIGMAQLRHAAGGVWQEWYAKLDGGRWGWLSEAQGQLYVTFERPDLTVPSIAALAPGTQVDLGGAMFTVAERGTATYTSALGEIPYRLAPGSSFQFADLSDGRGGFATIDYGDGSELPVVYLGSQVTSQSLGLSGGEAPAAAAPAKGARLACPSCNGPLELRAPDQTLRVACPYCGSLVSVESGAPSILARQARMPKPAVALGSTGRFLDGELTVIGYVLRSAYVEGTWWPFEEYLLYAAGAGFRWLVCSDGHWSYVQPIATGAVSVGARPVYDGVAFRLYQTAELRVDAVLGEFYWRVATGERVHSEDYIAPPAMLSREWSANEQNWSLASYLTPREVRRAFGGSLALPVPSGIAPNQPYPAGVGTVAALAFCALCAVGIGRCATAPATDKLIQRFQVPMIGARPVVDPSIAAAASSAGAGSDTPAEAPAGTVMFSEPFTLEGGKNVAFSLSAPVQNSWVYAALDLVNEVSGSVTSFDATVEYYAGIEDGESWSEGSTREQQVIGPVEPGSYVLRVEAQHGGSGDVALDVVIRQGVFRAAWFGIFFAVLAVPFAIVGFHAVRFYNRRWQNSTVGSHGRGSA